MHLRGFPCNSVTTTAQKTHDDAPTSQSRTFDELCFRLNIIQQSDGRTDGLTEMVNQDRAVSTVTAR